MQYSAHELCVEDELLTDVTVPETPSGDPTDGQGPANAVPVEAAPLTRRQLREQERAAAAAALEPAEIVPAIPAPDHAVAAVPIAEVAPIVVRPPRPVPLATTSRRPPASHHQQHGSHKRKSKRAWFSWGAMVAAAGMVTSLALPAYAYQDDGSLADASGKIASQSLTVAKVKAPQIDRGKYTAIENVAAWDSTTGTTVPLSVQQLAAALMADVAAGKLRGSTPDHIPEIKNLAAGVAVPNCGVDYRVLQVIKVAVDNFGSVGVSDINRRCTGQIEGAGTQSAHYADGGGHAVDFDMLNGQGLTGGDAQSMRLMSILDQVVPAGTHVGQMECRPSVTLRNLVPFDDSCTHLHIDFGTAVGTSLRE